MVKLSELRTAEEIHNDDLRRPGYRAQYERTTFANDVATKVIAYRTRRGLSQTEFGRMIGMRQPHVARLEAGEHEPSLSTLAKLSFGTGQDFSVDIKPSRVTLRHQASKPRQAPVRVASKAARASKTTSTSKAGGRTGKATRVRKVTTGGTTSGQGRKRS